MEATLQKALVLAEKTSSETQEAAKTRADSLMNEAETKVIALQKEAEAEIEALRKETEAYSEVTRAKVNQELADARDQVRKLVRSYENYRLQFKRLAESQIEMLEGEHYKIFEPELSEMLADAPTADEAMEKGEYRQNIHVVENDSKVSAADTTVPTADSVSTADSIPVANTVPIADTVPLPVEELNAVIAEMAQAPKVETSQLEDVQVENFKTVLPQTEPPKEEVLQTQAPQGNAAPVETPPVQMPQIEVPQTQAPPISVSPVQTPQTQVPPVQTPQTQVPQMEVSPAQTSQISVPPIQVQAQVPQAEVPPVQKPLVQTYQVPVSQIQTPQVEVPQAPQPQVAQQAVVSQAPIQPQMPQGKVSGLTADDMPPMFPLGASGSGVTGAVQTPQENPNLSQPVIPQAVPVKEESKSVSPAQGRQLTADDIPPIPSADDMPPIFPAPAPKADQTVTDSPFTFIDTE